MAKQHKDPAEKRVMVSVPMRYVLDAGAEGCSDLAGYIERLKGRIKRLQDALDARIAAAPEAGE